MTQETISEPTSNDITSNEPNTPNHLPVTKKLYLSDSTILEGEAIILSMEEISNESSNQPSQFNIILDQTYFHCQVSLLLSSHNNYALLYRVVVKVEIWAI